MVQPPESARPLDQETSDEAAQSTYVPTPPEPVRTSIARGGVSDRPTREDRLGFAPYVEGVADFLTDSEATRPITISVEGEWGSGKSSFLLQLESVLRERGCATVWFSGWRAEDAQTLWASAMLQLVRSLERDLDSWWARDLAQLRLRLARFRRRGEWLGLVFGGAKALLVAVAAWLLLQAMAATPNFQDVLFDGAEPDPSFFLGATGAAGILLGLGLGVRWLWRAMDNPLARELADFIEAPSYARHESLLAEIHQDLPEILRCYAGDKPVFLLVDDLDRAEPPHSARLMHALNLLITDTAQLNFVLALDRAKVAAGLAVNYEKLIPYLDPEAARDNRVAEAGVAFGWDFLEKFIQLSFRLPRADAEFIRGMLGGGSDGGGAAAPTRAMGPPLVEVTPERDDARFLDTVLLVAPALDYNPRRVKQFSNAFRLQAHVAARTGLFSTGGGGEPLEETDGTGLLSLPRLGKWVAIQQRWPEVVERLERDPDLLERLWSEAYTNDPDLFSGPPGLRRLLLAPKARGAGRGETWAWTPEELARFGMAGLDVEALLTIGRVVATGRSEAQARGRSMPEQDPASAKVSVDLPPDEAASEEAPSSRSGDFGAGPYGGSVPS